MQERMNEKRQACDKAHKKGRAEERWKTRKLYDIYTGKKAPEGASKSEQYINFGAYVRRHVECARITKRTYVNAITGELAPDITKETHQRRQHTTLYVWRVKQKYAEFSKILEAGGDLPAVPLKGSHKQQNAQAADGQKAGLPPTLAPLVLPIKKAEKLSTLFDVDTGKKAPEGASKSEQYITLNAYVKRHVESTQIARKTYVNAKTGEPAPGITKETHQSGEHTTLYNWWVSQKYSEFSKTIKEGGNLPPAPLRSRKKREQVPAADEQKADLPPAYSSQVSFSLSPGLESHVDDMPSADSFFAAEISRRLLASPTESDLTAHTVTVAGEQLPLVSKNATEKQVETGFDFYFSEPMTPLAFSPLSTTPLYASLAESFGTVTRPHLDPASYAAQDAFEQSSIRKRKPNFHSFFKPGEHDCAGHASKQAKTKPFDGSVEHPLTAADMPESTSGVSFMLSKRTVPF